MVLLIIMFKLVNYLTSRASALYIKSPHDKTTVDGTREICERRKLPSVGAFVRSPFLFSYSGRSGKNMVDREPMYHDSCFIFVGRVHSLHVDVNL